MILPPLDTSDLRTSRVTGVKRLAVTAARQRLSTATIEAVITAAADPRCHFRAQHTDGFEQVVDAAVLTNGRDWAYNHLLDPLVPGQYFNTMLEQARRMAAMGFARLDSHDRSSAVDQLAFDLITHLRPLEETGIRLSNWDAWSVWCHLLPLRLRGIIVRQDRERRLIPVSLDDVLPDPKTAGMLDLGSAPNLDEQQRVQLAWHIAHHLMAERTPGLLAQCRDGAQLRRATTVCEAALWALRRGAEDPDTRVMFSEDAVSAKLLAWRALAAVHPQTWGRYGTRTVPSRQVIERVAATIDPALCECTVGRTGKLRRCWFHSVSSRLQDLNGRKRVLHLTLAMVTERLKEGCLRVGLAPIEHPPAPVRPARARKPASPRVPQPDADGDLLVRQVRLGYPPRLGYDSTTLLHTGVDGVGSVTVQVVWSDDPHYAEAVRRHRAALERRPN